MLSKINKYNDRFHEIDTSNCLFNHQKRGREPFSTIKTVLFEHLQKQYPNYLFERPSGELVIRVDSRLNNTAFWEWIDNKAQELASYHSENTANWSKTGMQHILDANPMPNFAPMGASIAPNASAEPVVDANAQIHLSSSLIKKDFLPRVTRLQGIEQARSNPNFVFFPSKSTPASKSAVLKESSETGIQLNRILNNPKNVTWFNIAELLNQQLGPMRDRYTADTLICFFKGRTETEEAKRMDEASKAIIKRYLPDIQSYLDSPRERRNNERLLTVFMPVIQKERAMAAVSAILNRILMGPGAPKIKYIHAPGRPEHLQLLSSKTPGTRVFEELFDTGTDDALIFSMAPQIAAATIVRLVLGCSDMETKFDNFLLCNLGTQKKVVNIDTDFAFVTSSQDRLKNIGFDRKGAKALRPERFVPGYPTDGVKENWDMLFDQSDEAKVKEAMINVLQRVAVILSEDMINHVVDYVSHQGHGELALSPADTKELVAFLNKSRELVLAKLASINCSVDKIDPLAKAPWLKDMLDEMHSNKSTQSLSK